MSMKTPFEIRCFGL